MTISEELGLGGLAALGTVGSVCAILLRSAHQNLKTLDLMRRDASAAADKLRQELRDHDDTIFKLQSLCADYRYALAKMEAERDLLKRSLENLTSTRASNEDHSTIDESFHQRFSRPSRPEHWDTPPGSSDSQDYQRRPDDIL